MLCRAISTYKESIPLSSIENSWTLLYENNSKIGAFAVCKNNRIIWQTNNWNLADDTQQLCKAFDNDAPAIVIEGKPYIQVDAQSDYYIASAKKNGHILMCRVEVGIWLVAWAKTESEPELAIVDLARTALTLKNQL